MTIQTFTEIAQFMGSCFNSFFQKILSIEVAGVALSVFLSVLISISIAFSVIRKAEK